MGDVVDMMMDGTLCDVCGTVFADMLPPPEEFAAAKREKRKPVSNATAPGHPRTCDDCDDGEVL
jgi:hypothetical protein